MKKYFLLCLLFIGYQANSSDSLRSYYDFVSSAEAKICESNFSEASKLYQHAFTYKRIPFFSDIQNALLCELKSADVNKVKDSVCVGYFKMLLKKGFLRDTPIDDPFLLEIQRSCLWELCETELSRDDISTYNEKNRTLQDLLIEDQFIRQSCQSYDSSCVENVLKSDSIISERLKSLLLEDGFLDENVIGSHFVKINLRVLLSHQISRGNFETRNILLGAVYKGILDARFFAVLADRFYIQTNIGNFSVDTVPPFIYSGLYGTEYLRLYCDQFTQEMKCRKKTAFLMIDFNNQNMQNELMLVNKNREEIFLGDIISQSKHYLCLVTMNAFSIAAPIITQFDDNMGKRAIERLLNKYHWKLLYYIQDEHDFNF